MGFVPLVGIQAMYKDMGQRFFERNIRAALPESEAVNRALSKSFRRIVIEGNDDPSVFSFNHNGVTFAAERFEKEDGMYRVTEPRLLNGAQTVTTFARFLKENDDHPKLRENKDRLREIKVLCKIIIDAEQAFVTMVTVNNNRQNPVEPWNLRANDFVQLELQDKFRDDLRIYYERQEKAFEGLSDEELDEFGIQERTPITLLKLTQTFLVVEGEIDKISSIRRVFEDDKLYAGVFSASKLKADSRKIVLCYKIQFRLRKLLNEILEKGPSKYGYMSRARYLLWSLLAQGVLNDDKVEKYLEEFGRDMTIPANLTEYLSRLATTRARFIIADLVSEKANAEKIAEGKFGFLRSNAAYHRCMEIAYKRWRWVEKKLK
ncbi:MAG: AIPR family protein [Ignavibacteria bacterium]|nr:AIPR family protein [Ignavibacteria bacterium]